MRKLLLKVAINKLLLVNRHHFLFQTPDAFHALSYLIIRTHPCPSLTPDKDYFSHFTDEETRT